MTFSSLPQQFFLHFKKGLLCLSVDVLFSPYVVLSLVSMSVKYCGSLVSSFVDVADMLSYGKKQNVNTGHIGQLGRCL